ncbi:MAG: hypothetical protein QG549_892, partial [Patescibacteria group bacterium]|nr:hypothetical protein [Patescibacteria group bacterium]
VAIIVVVALVGAVGWLFWQNTVGKTSTSTTASTNNSTSTKVKKASPPPTATRTDAPPTKQ